jgi:MFS family permease
VPAGHMRSTRPSLNRSSRSLVNAITLVRGRKHLITAGMLSQAVALGLIAIGDTLIWWLLANAVLGAGTAMVYPTLPAVNGDVAHPLWRARASGSTDSGATAATPRGQSWAASPPIKSGSGN